MLNLIAYDLINFLISKVDFLLFPKIWVTTVIKMRVCSVVLIIANKVGDTDTGTMTQCMSMYP